MADDVYSALMGDAPTTKDQMLALAAQLRGQKLTGQLGMLSGDEMMAGVGKNLDTSADTQAVGVGNVHFKQLEDERARTSQAAQQANMEAERAQAKSALAETIREHNLQHQDRMLAAGFSPGGGSALGTLSPANTALVDDIGNHRAPPLNAGTTRNQQNKQIMAAVYEKYPQYSADSWKNLQDTVDKFGGGGGAQSPGAAIRQAGSAVLHMNRAMQDVKDLDNTTIVPLNQFTNWIRGEFGSSTLAGFNAKKNAIAAEVTKFLTASGGALEDRTRILKDLDAAQSPAALQNVVDSFKGMMADQMGQYKSQYRAGTYNTRDDFEDRMTDSVRDEFAVMNPEIMPSKKTKEAAAKAADATLKQPPGTPLLDPATQALLDKHAPRP